MEASTHRPRRRRLSGHPSVLCLAALLLAARPAVAGKDVEPRPVALSTTALRLDPEDPERQRVGRLIWRGGLEITAQDPQFGGLSGLLVSADGARLLAVGDQGDWLGARLRYDVDGRLIGLEDGQMARLRGRDGAALTGKRWSDAEGLAEFPDGSVLVSFERKHRIWRYGREDGSLPARPTVWPSPEGLDEAPSNGGLEALTSLPDGGLLALTEDQQAGDAKAGYLWRDGAWFHLAYRPAEGFKPTGASVLPGSDDLLVLERAVYLLSGFNVRLVRIASRDIQPGAVLQGEEIARWSSPFTVDNFEAVAARRDSEGRTLVYLLSDDNFEAFQRTLLLMFELEE